MTFQGQFVVYCNNNNPIGYTRTTQKSKWNENSIKYEIWKRVVANTFLNECPNLRVPKRTKCKLEIMIYYKNDIKSDPDNVFKGIADALSDTKLEKRLYKNDNYITGSFDFNYDKSNPRVLVSIFY